MQKNISRLLSEKKRIECARAVGKISRESPIHEIIANWSDRAWWEEVSSGIGTYTFFAQRIQDNTQPSSGGYSVGETDWCAEKHGAPVMYLHILLLYYLR